MSKKAIRLALEALEKLNNTNSYWWQEVDADVVVQLSNAETALREALAEQPAQQEHVNLRRGDLLRCIETDELCTVWATSPTGNTLIKWSANNFGNYTAEQIGELFWLEPAQQEHVAIVAVDGLGQIQVGWITKPQHNDKLYTFPPPQFQPLDRDTILNIHAMRNWPRTQFADKGYGIVLDTVTVIDFARAIESSHGIKE